MLDGGDVDAEPVEVKIEGEPLVIQVALVSPARGSGAG